MLTRPESTPRTDVPQKTHTEISRPESFNNCINPNPESKHGLRGLNLRTEQLPKKQGCVPANFTYGFPL